MKGKEEHVNKQGLKVQPSGSREDRFAFIPLFSRSPCSPLPPFTPFPAPPHLPPHLPFKPPARAPPHFPHIPPTPPVRTLSMRSESWRRKMEAAAWQGRHVRVCRSRTSLFRRFTLAGVSPGVWEGVEELV